MFTVETLDVDGHTILIMAKKQIAFGRVISVTEGTSGHEIASAPTDNPSPSGTGLANPRFKGVRYDTTEGKITGYVLEGTTTSGASERLTLQPANQTEEFAALGFSLPSPQRHLAIEPTVPMPLPKFEEACKHFAQAYPRTAEEPGSVLVRPCVVQELRNLEKKRLTTRTDPRTAYPSSGAASESGLPPRLTLPSISITIPPAQ